LRVALLKANVTSTSALRAAYGQKLRSLASNTFRSGLAGEDVRAIADAL